MPRHTRATRTDDSALIAAYLAAVEDLPTRDAGALIGVSHETVWRWRKGPLPAHVWRGATREAIQRYLAARGITPERRAVDWGQVRALGRELERAIRREDAARVRAVAEALQRAVGEG